MKKIVLIFLFSIKIVYPSINQTDDVSPVSVTSGPPFKITIEQTNMQIPGGIQSFVRAQDGSNYLFLAGRTNGLHGFANSGDFPRSRQNTTLFVINTCAQTVHSRSLYDKSAGLTQSQIDTLSVVSPQAYQSGNTLYITGGYGFDTKTNSFLTQDKLTAINVSGLIHWVTHSSCTCRAADYLRQISDPIFQVTGGEMFQFGQCPTLLIFGQNFIGEYRTSSNGIYTQQVRKFDIIDDGKTLKVNTQGASSPDPSFRRRDLNVIPIIKTDSGKNIPAYVALSGVFTLDGGIWTVPVEITTNGTPSMADPALEDTFKQAMNNYNSAHLELLSPDGDMYSVLFGGITFGFFQDGQFMTSTEFPFTNQVTAVRRSSDGKYDQFLLPVEYPTIESTQSNPGNTLRFGAGARFITEPNMPVFGNGVLDLSKIRRTTTIGYIVGGIQSTLANTNVPSDSAASPYIFRVSITPN